MADYPALDLRFAPGVTLADEELLQAGLDDLDPIAIQEYEPSAGWLVFFPGAASRDTAAAALTRAFPALLASVTARDVPDEDWARRTQANLGPVRVGRITVAPPWNVPEPEGAGDIVVVIDPSMGFGTGHHETTRLCLALLQRLDHAGKSVIDVGTGSGVLAIAAWKLGAASVTAVDHDADALQNARENVERNGGREAIEVVQADIATCGARPADLVLANLTGAVLARHAAVLRGLVAPRGALIVSGFSPEGLPEVIAAIGSGARIEQATEGAWAAAIVTPTTA